MDRNDFVKLIGTGAAGSDYLPVAFLLRSGYACAGYYNRAINSELSDTCVILNAHLLELQGDHATTGRPSIHDFNDFLEEIVMTFYSAEGPPPDGSLRRGLYGKSIPLAAIPFDEIAVMYPVSHIAALIGRADAVRSEEGPSSSEPPASGKKASTFLDLDRSEIINLLRTKLW